MNSLFIFEKRKATKDIMQDGEDTFLVHDKGIKFNTALNTSSASINLDDENEGESANRLIEQPEN